MDSSKLVEGCPFLSISSIKRDLLRYMKNNGDISGIASIGYGKNAKVCNYWFDSEFNNETDRPVLMVSFDGSEPQKIRISEQLLSFGTRHYLVCNCGRRACKLFMPNGKTLFKCRQCYHLNYELCMINRNSIHGRLFYETNRKIKLVNKQTQISRMLYKGQFTHRYNRFLKLCKQAGFNNVVENAKELIEAINNQNL